MVLLLVRHIYCGVNAGMLQHPEHRYQQSCPSFQLHRLSRENASESFSAKQAQ